jgi:hypothetical protein
VQAVICADDTNPYTHIPLLLAVQKGISTIACHHGALDGRHMIKQNHADVVLAKGKMEQDYLVRRCGIRPQVVEIGAPRLSESCVHKPDSQKRSLILFFSEAYEVASGRARGFYQDMLPLLAKLALSERKQLIIKLHPSESFAERSRLVREILSYEEQQIVKVIDRASNQDLLDRTWFAVTIMSSVVVECALRQVPCFLCAWLESWPYGYCDQFTRFQVGIRLNKPAEISSIPSILDSYQVSTATRENCWTPIEAQRFGELLGFSPRSQAVAHTQD